LGLVTHAQLVGCGLSPGQIRYLVREGTLIRVYRGVYRTPGSSATAIELRALAACFACGDDAVSSHRTAGTFRGLIDGYEGQIEVTIPGHQRPRRPGIRTYRRTLTGDECTKIGPVPVTVVERTLLDLSACVDPCDLEEAVDRAFRSRSTTPKKMDLYLPVRGESNARGIGVLRSIVQDRLGLGVPESVLESKMLALLKRSGLPTPVRQYLVTTPGRSVRFDMAYPNERVAIETDGRAPHWGRERWQADHRRDNRVELAGWKKLSFTWWDVTRDEAYVALTVAQALGLRPSSWRRRH
jgi:hypothetical protein